MCAERGREARGSTLTFVFLVFALSIPLWVIGAVTGLQLLEGLPVSALRTGILLGMAWAVWHVVPYAQAHRSPVWIAWQGLDTVATRVLVVWVYANTGRSVLAASLFHAIGNVFDFTFPNFGSHYDPRVTGLITTVAAVVVTVVWGPRTLARRGHARGVTRDTG